MKYVKSLQLETYCITYTSEVLQIGCKQYPIEDWWKFSDEEISAMDDGALEFWSKYRDLIQTIIETSSASPTT